MIVKYIHLACVIATFLLFFIRGVWMVTDSGYLKQKWTRVVPPVIDTTLLGSAIILAISIRQYPLVDSWLTAKVAALLLYIGLGMIALTYGRTRVIRLMAWVGALLTFGYIIMVALTRNPLIIF